MGVQEYHRQPILQALFQRLHFACWYLFVLTLIPGKSLLVMDHLHYCGKTHCSYLLTHLMVHYCDGLLSSKASSQLQQFGVACSPILYVHPILRELGTLSFSEPSLS